VAGRRRGVDYSQKDKFNWISVIRLPDFVSKKILSGERRSCPQKENDCSLAEFLTIKEGLCVQALHLGPFDDEPKTVAKMDEYLIKEGYEKDFSNERLHHKYICPTPARLNRQNIKRLYGIR